MSTWPNSDFVRLPLRPVGLPIKAVVIARPAQLDIEEWTSQFAKALTLEYRKDLSAKLARAIAGNQWSLNKKMDPWQAAMRWAQGVL